LFSRRERPTGTLSTTPLAPFPCGHARGSRFPDAPICRGWWDVVESHQVHVLAPSVLRDLEQINHSLEPRRTRDGRRDIGEANGDDRFHLDMAFAHPIASAKRHPRTQPDAHAAGDLAASHPFAQALREEHCNLTTAAFRRLRGNATSLACDSLPTPTATNHQSPVGHCVHSRRDQPTRRSDGLATQTLEYYRPCRSTAKGGMSCEDETTSSTASSPFEPSSKRRKGIPVRNPRAAWPARRPRRQGAAREARP
jgi:hypothetical protein